MDVATPDSGMMSAGMPGMAATPGGMAGTPGMAGAMEMSGMMGMAPGSAGMMGPGMPGMPGMGAATGRPAAVVNLVDTKQVADAALEPKLGLLLDTLKAELSRRASAGEFGAVLPGLAAEGPAAVSKVAMTGASFPSPGQGEPMTWIPGVDFLGVGAAKVMIEAAREQEYDLLFHFDVIAKTARSGEPQYDARLRLMQCSNGEPLAVSKTVNKRDVLMAAKRRGIPAVLQELLQPLFDGIDARVQLRPLPPLTPQQAATRIDALLASPEPDRIEHLAEIVMFHHKKLIDDEQLDQIFYFIAGEDGLRLLHDTPEQRELVVEKFVSRALDE